MATTEKITIRGLNEVEASLARYERGIRKAASAAAYQAAKIVALDARSRFSVVDRRSAMGFVPNTRGPQARVRQRRSKTTGQHPQYGSLQMRKALLPALYSKRDEALALFEVQFETLKKASGL